MSGGIQFQGKRHWKRRLTGFTKRCKFQTEIKGKLKGGMTMLKRILHFMNVGIWEIRLKDLPLIKALPIKVLRVVILAARGFMKNGCQKKASVLTYYSLLNIVPIVAVVFGVAKGFGFDKLIEKQILQMAQKGNWQSDLTSQILGFSHKLLENVKGGIIAGVGVILLFWSIVSILGKIETSLNDVWEVRTPRTLVRKFSDYIAMMILGPILLVISSSATVLVASQVKFLAHKIGVLGFLGPVISFFLSLLPYVSMWTLLSILYLILPNTKVPIRAGILGGVAAGTIFQIIQWIYIKFQIGVASYGAIYGSFAALPLFLGWVQMSWMIVLFGSEIAHASVNYETYGFHPDYSRISVSSKRLLVLRIFRLVIEKFSTGEKPLSISQIAHVLEIPVRLVQQLLHELADIGLVAETASGIKNQVAFQPARAIEGMTLKYALDAYDQHGATAPHPPSEEAEKISGYLKEISETIEKSPGNLKLKDL
jgi:membrane protein